MRRDWRSSSASRQQRGDLINVYQCQEDGPVSSQWFQTIRQEATGRNWCTRSSTSTHGRTSSLWGDQIDHRGCGISIAGDIQDLSGHNPVQCVLGWLCLSREARSDNPLWSLSIWPGLWFWDWSCSVSLLQGRAATYCARKSAASKSG